MVHFVLLDKNESEAGLVDEIVRDLAAKLTDEKWEIRCFDELAKQKEYLKQEPLIDFDCCDVLMDGVLESLGGFRSSYKEAGLMLIVEETVSPLLYLRPGIRADALLMRPVRRDTAKASLEEFLRAGLKQSGEDTGNECFTVETNEGHTFIPYDKLYYFEAREKKIFARTRNEEYGFYASLEEMREKLPAYFQRCHRSFIVNTKLITKVASARNAIELTNGFEVPLSRSYKGEFRQYSK